LFVSITFSFNLTFIFEPFSKEKIMAHSAQNYLSALNDEKLDQKVWTDTQVPQSEKADSRQVKNNAGGFTFQLDQMGRLDRFLILGADKPTYYVGKDRLALENAKSVVDLIKQGKGKTTHLIKLECEATGVVLHLT
jgi:hypothetical protein